VRRVCVLLLFGMSVIVATAAPAASAPDRLADVDVAGAAGEKPTLEFAKPFVTKKSANLEISAGSGDALTKGAKVTFNFSVVNGRTGKELESTFGDKPATLVLDRKRAVPALVKGLVGTAVGGRVLVAVSPKEGLTTQLQQSGVKKSDTLLFVVDVTGVRTPLTRAAGEPVPPVDGLPTVKLADDGQPTITSPQSVAPTELVAQTLVKGTGPAVTVGQTITVHYTGVIWDGGKEFDSSWKRGEPVDFPIGVKQVIPGWDEGLVGQTVGSQVLLVVPPEKGYGPSGSPDAGITGTDTLVFVVDILDAF